MFTKQPQENALMPYHATLRLAEGAALVLAPHPDDEVFGCGGAILRHVASGEQVTVVLVTDGAPAGNADERKAIAVTRLAESERAAAILGYGKPIGWGWQDRQVAYGETLIKAILDTIERTRPAIVYAPSLFEYHPDHRAVALAAMEAVRRVGGDLLLAQYEVGAQFRPSHLLDISALVDAKRDAMEAFDSQLAAQRYDLHVAALNRLRTYTLGPDVSAAEGYVVLSADALRADPSLAFGPYRPTAVLDGTAVTPAQLPLVSVLVRSANRASLGEALLSVATQTYPNIELLVVNVTGAPHGPLPPLGPRVDLRFIDGTEKLPRPRAANRLLDDATGEWLLFLDDDDLLDPDHIAKLVAGVTAQTTHMAAYSGVRLVDAVTGAVTGQLDQPFDADRIWISSYLPIHAILFSSRLLSLGCRFDPAFEVYEDWDFWLQVIQQTRMLHLPGATATYRIHNQQGSGVHDGGRNVAGYAALMRKWQNIQGDAVLDHVGRAVAALEQGQASQLSELRTHLDAIIRSKDGDISHLQDATATLTRSLDVANDTYGTAMRSLTDELGRLRDMVTVKDGHISNLQGDTAQLKTEAVRLQTLVTDKDQLIAERQDRINEQLALVHSLNLQLAAQNQTLSAQAQQLEVQRDQLADQMHARQALNERLSVLDAAHHKQTDELLALHGQYQDAVVHVRNLEHIMQGLRAELASMVNSRSWRMTAPVRKIGLLLRKVKRALGSIRRAAARSRGWLPLLGKAARVYRREGWAGIKRRLAAKPGTPEEISLPPAQADERTPYEQWIAHYDTPSATTLQAYAEQMAGWRTPPLISILMPVYNTPEIWLRRVIDTVRAQIYPHWELCIADDASPDARVAEILAEYAKLDSRIKVVRRERNGHISAASNSALAVAKGEFIALLDHDDELPAHALFLVAREIAAHPDADLIYTDEDKIGEDGRRFDPHFKPDWNPDLFLAYNFISHLGVYRRRIVEAIGGFREGFEGSQDYDLALRFIEKTSPAHIRHVPHVAYHWRVIPGSTAAGHGEKPYAFFASKRAIEEHLERTGIKATVDEATEGSGYFRVKREVAGEQPHVTIIIPTRDGYDLLTKCIDSIQQKTHYSNYSILVIDNGSVDPKVLDYLKQKTAEGLVQVLRDDRPFNYSALNNAAAKLASGPLLCFMNNDIEVIEPEWLDELVSHAQRPTVGAVGCKLLYPTNTNQHAGVIIGVGGVAGHAHHGLPREAPGYFSRAQVVQNYSAVTAACVLMRKSVFDEVGGFNERDLAVAFNDIDLCLKIQEKGYFNVWTPFAVLYHYESASRGFEDTPEKQARFAKEIDYMMKTWGKGLPFDPAYNPNLSLVTQDYTLAHPPRRLLNA
jgi:glycosyltransferase involved in cell wall biosynthesis/LmbE family N-acetylglucosaminyl deacetylase